MCKKLINALFNIGQDKWMHYTVSLLIVLFIYAICAACGLGIWSVIPAFAVSMGAGLIKEKSDAKHSGRFDHYDIVADFLGCFTAMVLIAILLI